MSVLVTAAKQLSGGHCSKTTAAIEQEWRDGFLPSVPLQPGQVGSCYHKGYGPPKGCCKPQRAPRNKDDYRPTRKQFCSASREEKAKRPFFIVFMQRF